MKDQLTKLEQELNGELYFDDLHRHIYATDASVYKKLPLAVCYPKSKEDIKKLIRFATQHKSSLIPRAAGTSLAGQCVGEGIVVDVSKHFYGILEVNDSEGWVRVQPGVVRDQLNKHLQAYNLFFGPNTSTANRAMIGGMVGNNSCGSYSIVYGTTRDHVLEVKGILSDGSEVCFKALDEGQFQSKKTGVRLENKIYTQINEMLSNEENRNHIQKEFPKSSIHRRNTGYAIDELLALNPFSANADPFNLSKLICGSEGTLMFITEIKLHCDPLPPKNKLLVAAHFESVQKALKATVEVMALKPRAVELMDDIILECTKGNIQYSKYRFFVEGNPGAILLVEVGDDELKKCNEKADKVIKVLKDKKLGYAFPLVQQKDISKVWALRSAGLGLLSNVPGDAKAVAVIEDTAVEVADLPDYIAEFTEMMNGYNQRAVYYAHAGAGELHLRPLLNLKEKEDRKLFRAIAKDTADLVKKYEGSLSGEHGDGIVRAEFIPLMVGEHNYNLFKEIKKLWDPHNIFNPGKIVDAPPMDEDLRYDEGQLTPEVKTTLDFSSSDGFIRAIENCNGSGDCRKLAFSGGTMCPSYMASRNEKDTTRARANLLRQLIQESDVKKALASDEAKEILDLCLSCKGCTAECPSNVDMASIKAEVMHQHYKINGVPLRNRLFSAFSNLNKLAALMPGVSNAVFENPVSGSLVKKLMGLANERSLPLLQDITLRKWLSKHRQVEQNKRVFLFVDEFTNYNDTGIGIKTVLLLNRLGYYVETIKHDESGRTAISKGLLDKAVKHAENNVLQFADKLGENDFLIGIEPSAILSFRDEYPKLVKSELKEKAKALSQKCLTIEEFLFQAYEKGEINSHNFISEKKRIVIHGHCHQKALSKIDLTQKILSIPLEYDTEIIPSGCCGMAGSFGYEKEHYKMSMDIGELVLFPSIRKENEETIIAAAGTSCRHQIKDGTERIALHPVEILFAALKK